MALIKATPRAHTYGSIWVSYQWGEFVTLVFCWCSMYLDSSLMARLCTCISSVLAELSWRRSLHGPIDQ